MRRFFVERMEPADDQVRVTSPEADHITRVLRMGPGERLILMDGTGARFQAVIRSTRPGEVLLDLERALPAPPPSPVEITLCASLLKSRPMDLMIQKTSELGVHRIQPMLCTRTTVRLPPNRVESRLRHWREIARSAAKQADRAVPAHVEGPKAFEDVLMEWRESRLPKVLLYEGEASLDLKTLLRRTRPEKGIAMVVGPEGGFTPREVDAARTSGFVPVSLGRRILRSETAGLAVVTVAQYEWGDLGIENEFPKNQG